MDSPIVSALAQAGVLERRPGRPGRSPFLRTSPRFLAHAEAVANRHRAHGHAPTGPSLLAAALATWDEYRHDAWHGALALADLMEERDQWGTLRPVFPVLESFAPAIA